MTGRLGRLVDRALAKRFPERRLFLRTDSETRYVRLRPITQVAALAGGMMVLGWTLIVTAMLLMNNLGTGDLRQQAAREQAVYEARISALSAERDRRVEEALAAQGRFSLALGEISKMQSELLRAEERRAELTNGIDVLQSALTKTRTERDDAKAKAATLLAELDTAAGSVQTKAGQLEDMLGAVDFLTAALAETATARDVAGAAQAKTAAEMDEILFAHKLVEDRNDRIFQQLEDAVSVSLEPLDKMFEAAGLPADQIIESVRRGYSGHGGPLTPLSYSTKGVPADADSLRADEIMKRLDHLNVYRIAAELVPFDMPLKAANRFTSGFGPRRDPKTGGSRMHNGSDFAAAYGTPIYATADGVVTHADWLSGYGRLVKIKHDFGIETRYAHLAKIRVKIGQKVSRGDRIGDMGNSGRSTGTHLHYEVRIDDKPVNPMKFIKAARDVF